MRKEIVTIIFLAILTICQQSNVCINVMFFSFYSMQDKTWNCLEWTPWIWNLDNLVLWPVGWVYISYGERLVKNNLESQEEIFSLGSVNQSEVAQKWGIRSYCLG